MGPSNQAAKALFAEWLKEKGHEDKRKGDPPAQDLKVKTPPFNAKRGNNPKKAQQTKQARHERNVKSEKAVVCFGCGKPGHFRNECPDNVNHDSALAVLSEELCVELEGYTKRLCKGAIDLRQYASQVAGSTKQICEQYRAAIVSEDATRLRLSEAAFADALDTDFGSVKDPEESENLGDGEETEDDTSG